MVQFVTIEPGITNNRKGKFTREMVLLENDARPTMTIKFQFTIKHYVGGLETPATYIV